MKSRRWLLMLLLGLFVISCAKGVNRPLHLQYQSAEAFPSLQQKIGPVVGIAPFKDERTDKSQIGIHAPLLSKTNYFISDPVPLEQAIQKSISQVLPRYEIQTVPVANWDGKPDALGNIVTDSILLVEIKKFWIEEKGSLFGTKVHASIQLVIRLGVKKEGKVFSKNVEVEREMKAAWLTPAKTAQTVNELLAEIFDNFFSNPY